MSIHSIFELVVLIIAVIPELGKIKLSNISNRKMDKTEFCNITNKSSFKNTALLSFSLDWNLSAKSHTSAQSKYKVRTLWSLVITHKRRDMEKANLPIGK